MLRKKLDIKAEAPTIWIIVGLVLAISLGVIALISSSQRLGKVGSGCSATGGSCVLAADCTICSGIPDCSRQYVSDCEGGKVCCQQESLVK